nr:hypothetical protein [Tanacetum cinerariifolium]
MIPEPGDTNHEVPVNETFHVQTDDELTEKELKQIEADDQAIQTILLGFLEDIYATVDICETAQEICNLKFLNNLQPEWSRYVTIVHQTKDLHTADYTQLYDFLEYNQKECFNKINHHSIRTTCNNQYHIPKTSQILQLQLALMAKAFKLNYSTPTNNNLRISSNPRNRQIAQPGINMGLDRQMQMVGGNGGNQFRKNAGQNVGNLNGYNHVQNVENQVIQNAVQNPRN